ncbi:MAG: xanthine dehydrogenase family protein molybdopterin-binding subunit [Clostridiales bacterium]|nr:xanthine dehydrogenase family protein molybdopterin-binding subunit [Clostridiales bacterium]
MDAKVAVGKGIIRVDAYDKAMGRAKFNSDYITPDTLHCKMLISQYAHAKIKSIDIKEAQKAPGVQGIITGESAGGVMTGTFLEDRPPLAVGKVRYYGEPVAVVIANTEYEAKKATELIKIEYEQLPVINSPGDALKPNATLVHENMADYRIMKECLPKPGTNIANHVKIRKGNMGKGWEESEVIVEETLVLPQADHLALETRSAKVEIKPDGRVIIHSTSQGTFIIKKKLSRHFNIDAGKITVHTPFVGGAFGGKAAVQLEMIAYLASKEVGGRQVILINTREEDMISSPCRIGLEAKVKLGAKKDGKIKAAEITYLVDSGAYSDMGAVMTKSMACDCTGPYSIDNVWCDSICVYTNHPYVVSFRGFGHSEFTAVIERAIDKLANTIGMDKFELRLKNVVVSGDTTPTQSSLTQSNIGNLSQCLARLKEIIKWDEGEKIDIDKDRLRSKGIACFWKTSSTPPDAASGAIITFSPDGYANLSIGVAELGQGSKTVLAQILAEKLKLDVKRINVTVEIDTDTNPEHWKTVASSSTFMVGNAVIDAADDVIRQLKEISSIVLRCPAKDLDVAGGKVFMIDNPKKFVDITEVIHGYKYPNGNSIGGQIIGRGSYIMKLLSGIDEKTGKGKPGPLWTVGAQAVEVEFNKKDYSYKITKASSVIDAGTIINPSTAKSVTMGGISMGLSLASREAFLSDENGIILNPNLRTYKPIRFAQEPEYVVEFVETPELDGPYGARGLGEHGLVGIPAALLNCLSTAINGDLNQFPLTPELIWKTATGVKK